MTNTVESSDDYLEKLKKTIPGDLTAIFISFRLIVANTYGFEGGTPGDAATLNSIVDYVRYLLTFMIPLVFIGFFYLRLVSRIESILQIVVILISYVLWMLALDISFYSAALKDGTRTLFEVRLIDVILADKVAFVGITLLWTFSVPIIYAAATKLGWMK
jgi:hypothetical protein